MEAIFIAFENDDGKTMLFRKLLETFLHLKPTAEDCWVPLQSLAGNPSYIYIYIYIFFRISILKGVHLSFSD